MHRGSSEAREGKFANDRASLRESWRTGSVFMGTRRTGAKGRGIFFYLARVANLPNLDRFARDPMSLPEVSLPLITT